MVLKHFFDISTGFRYKKNGKEFSAIYRDELPIVGIALDFAGKPLFMHFTKIETWDIK